MIPGKMETLREALMRMERQGFTRSFRAVPEGQLEVASVSRFDPDVRFDPEALVLEETARFEGASDPEDQAVLFALRTPDGRVKGTFVASYGPGMDRDCVAAVQRLDRERDPGTRLSSSPPGPPKRVSASPASSTTEGTSTTDGSG